MHSKLGEFIRTHRERVTPANVGLPSVGRRRTSGLRREELAQLCDVSPTWLTWLEQGRPVQASAKLLANMARVLHLTPAERAYLFSLADKLDPALAPSLDTDAAHPPADLAAIVKAVRAPAYMLDQYWDAVAWNRPALTLFTGWLDQRAPAGAGPNLLRFMFLAAPAQVLIVDWPDRAARLVAEFRADCGKYADQPPLAGLVAELGAASAPFRALWQAQHVLGREGGTRRFLHPRQGALTFEQVTLQVANRRGLKLVMLIPA